MNINLYGNVNVGNLTELKISKIKELLGKEFPNGISMPGQLVITGNKEQIIFTPTQIQYVFAHDEFEKVEYNFKQIQRALMLDEKMENSSIVITSLKDIKKDSMEYTKIEFKSLITNSIGVGIREFFKYKDELCEMKLEPFLNDSKNLYLEAIYNLKYIDIDSINSVIKDIKDDYTVKREEVYENLKLD